MDRLDQLLTPTELAGYLGVPVATLYAWRHRRQGLPSFRAGRHLRYRLRDIERHGAGVRYLAPPDEPRVVTVQRVAGLNRWLDNPCTDEAGS
jgi:excisionase family DNA binding protein